MTPEQATTEANGGTNRADEQAPETPSDVWHFRGYHMRPSEFNTAMVHLYRGEITRSNVSRTRLDQTTNWAVITTGAALSFIFSSTENSHIMIQLTTLLVTLFLFLEARRYQYYELWSHRVRLMETDFFGHMLSPPFTPSEEWATLLSDSLIHPQFTISIWEAFGRRFRRNYQYVFLILAMAWILKIILHPTQSLSLEAFLRDATVGPVPGTVVLALGLLYNGIIFAIGWSTVGLAKAKGEILADEEHAGIPGLVGRAGSYAPQFLRGRKGPFGGKNQLAYVITNKGEEVAQEILQHLGRGVTAVPGKGMYSGTERLVLLVAIHSSQIGALKKIVYRVDEDAFVVFNPAGQVVGRGFQAPS